MIDKKKLIEEIYARHDFWINKSALNTILHIIDEQPKAGEWIPCSERLPEMPEDTDDKDCPEFNVMIKGASVATTLKYSPDGAWFDDLGQVYEVIAWMPLPEPWEGRVQVKGRIVKEIEEIPKDCFSCNQVNEYGYCQWINKYIDCCSEIGERYPTCPIELWEGK